MSDEKQDTPPWGLKLYYRPHELDDWGTIRTETGDHFAQINYPKSLSKQELREHRNNGTDPYGCAAKYVVKAWNTRVNTKAITDMAEAIRIKPLDWGRGGKDWAEVYTPFGRYIIYRIAEKAFKIQFGSKEIYIGGGYSPTLDKAKKTAQEHWESKIKKSLSTHAPAIKAAKKGRA